MSSGKLFFKTRKFKLLNQIDFLADSSLDVFTEVPRIFNEEIAFINLCDGPCIWIHVFHSFDVMDGHKISSLIIVRGCSGNFTSLCGGNVSDVDFGEILSGVIHFPLISKIINNQAKEAHLSSIKNNSFGLFLGPDKLIDTNDSSEIPDITKDNNIVFETIFLSDLSVDFIDINFVIKFVTHFNQVICTGFLINELSWVV